METNQYNDIPEELRILPQWVTHKAKIPYNPATGEKAKSGQPETWDTFAAALDALKAGEYDGLGFEFHNNGIVGIDLDKAIDEDGKPKTWALEIVETLNSYTEYSVSVKGLHIFIKGDIPADGRKKKLSDTGEAVELYKARRYFAMTGNVFRAVSIAVRQAEIMEIYNKYFPAPKPQSEPPQFPPPELGGKDYLSIGLERDRKFRALWNGERPKEDESANDLSLMNKLAYWCNRDILAMITAFMSSPFVASKDEKHRAKLNREDYLQRTAQEAAAKMGATALQHDKDYQQGNQKSATYKNSGASVKPDEFTDAGNAAVFVRQYANKAVFLPSMGWLVWNGKNWVDSDLEAVRLALEVTRQMLLEARAGFADAVKIGDKDRMKSAGRYFKHMLTSRNQPQIERMLELAKADLQHNLEDLDADPHILNTPAGMVDLKTGEMKPHNPTAYCTKITGCAPGEQGREEWESFLKTISCGEDKLIWFLQQIAGMAAVGRVYMENLVIAYGEGNNGKSTFFNTLRYVLGTYSRTIDPDVLTTGKQKKGADYAELKGKRLVIAAELDEGTRLSTKALKQLSSTDDLPAERKYRQPEEFTPTHSLILFTNHLPRVGSMDSGTWRRIVVCPFKANIPKSDEKKNYAEQLFERCGGAILNWVIDGAVDFCKNGHQIYLPEIIQEAIEEYQDSNNWIQDFFDECCELGADKTARAGELLTVFREWAQRSGEYIRKKEDFNAALRKHGLSSHRYSYGVVWSGISIKQQEHNYSRRFPYLD